ncbi:MAG: hypothetical protein PW734_09685 [Verrucomicrobium sp.]|nr:hypothetical protein [Verrucomicrobium sp.]
MIARLLCLGLLLVAAGCSEFDSFDATHTERLQTRPLYGQYYYLPEGRIHLTGKYAAPSWTVTVDVDLLADPAARFYFRPDNSFLDDVDDRITVNGKGLLDTATSATTSSSPPAALTIAQMSPVSVTLDAPGAAPEKASFNYSFDPFDADKADRVRQELAKLGLRMKMAPSLEKGPTRQPVYEKEGKYPGILFRPVVPVRFTFRVKDASALEEQQAQVCVPDPRTLLAFDMNRAPLIPRVAEVQFRDGILISSHVNKPSIGTAIITVPLQMIHTVFTGGL